MKKIVRNAVVTVAGVAMLGMLSLGCIKLVNANTAANREMQASIHLEEKNMVKAEEATSEAKLEVTTEAAVTKKTNNANVVKAADKEIVGKESDVAKVKSTKNTPKKTEKSLDKNLDKKSAEIVENKTEPKYKGSKYYDYFVLNGVSTPEEIASMGPDKFCVSDDEWKKAAEEWTALNPDTEEEAPRGEYETAKWYEILEYYGIRESDNEQGWEYIQDPSVENAAGLEDPIEIHVSDEEWEAAKAELMKNTGCSEEEAELLRSEYKNVTNNNQ